MLSILTAKTKQCNGLWVVLGIFITLILVISQVFAYVRTHQIVHIKYVSFFAYQVYFSLDLF